MGLEPSVMAPSAERSARRVSIDHAICDATVIIGQGALADGMAAANFEAIAARQHRAGSGQAASGLGTPIADL
jgi:hypothetical protein